MEEIMNYLGTILYLKLFVLDLVLCNTLLPTIEPGSTKIYVSSDEDVQLKCPIKCSYCSKASIKWTINGKPIENDSSHTIKDSLLIIRSFQSYNVGNYKCVFLKVNDDIDESIESKLKHYSKWYGTNGSPTTDSIKTVFEQYTYEYGVTSFSIRLELAELPKLLFRSVSTQLNESAVLKCFEDGFKQVAYLQTKWFKNNAEINSIEGRYLIFGNVLVILRTTVADEGNYTCQVAFQTWTHVNRSAVQRLSIETGKQTSAGPLKIVYFSSIQEGKNNSNLQILCIVNRAVEASILKETAILRRSLKLIRKKHYAIYTTEIMEENESVVYKCETENEIERVAKRELVKVEGVFSSKVDDFYKVIVRSSEKIECRFNEEIPPMEGHITWYLNGYPLNDETRANQQVLVIKKEKENAGIYQCFDSEKDYFAGKPYYVELDGSLSPFNLTANVSDDMNITVNWKQPVTAIDVNDTYYQLTRQCQPYELHKSTYIDNITFAGKPVVTSCPYCKSFTCKIELCLMQKHKPGKKYCAHIFKKMKSTTEPPSMPPTIEKVIGGRESMYVHFELPDVEWRNGEILYSKVFLQQLSLKDGRMESIAENIESFPDTSSLLYYHEYGLYRIWAQCFNEAGGSPLSEVAFLDLEYDPNSTWFIKNFNSFQLDATVSLAGDPLNTTYPTLTFNNALKIKEEVLGFILYITKVPCKSYWNSTTSVKVGANTAKYEFKEFQGNANYRITLAVIHEEILDDGYPHPLRFKETSKYVKNFFSPSEDFKFVTKKRLDQHSVFSRNPQSFQCHSYNKTSILFAWLPPCGFVPDQNYTLHVLDEKCKEVVYSIRDLHKWVLDLQGTWYHARLQAHYEKHDHEANYTTDYITCSTTLSEPGDIPEFNHELIFYRKKQKGYTVMETDILLKWKPPPNYREIYSYQLVLIASLSTDKCGKKKGISSFVWPKFTIFYPGYITVLMEGDVLESYRTTGYITTKPVKLRENADYLIFLIAKNLRGTSVAERKTKCIEELNWNTSFHNFIEKEGKHHLLTPSTSVDSFDPKPGISIGISIVIALVLLAVVILFLIKRFWVRRGDGHVGIPLEQEEQLLRQNATDSDTFLYLQKLKEIREQNSINSSKHNRGQTT